MQDQPRLGEGMFGELGVVEGVVAETAAETFGEGMVLSLSPMGGDTLVEVAFDKVGTKKLMSNFANLKKV